MEIFPGEKLLPRDFIEKDLLARFWLTTFIRDCPKVVDDLLNTDGSLNSVRKVLAAYNLSHPFLIECGVATIQDYRKYGTRGSFGCLGFVEPEMPPELKVFRPGLNPEKEFAVWLSKREAFLRTQGYVDGVLDKPELEKHFCWLAAYLGLGKSHKELADESGEPVSEAAVGKAIRETSQLLGIELPRRVGRKKATFVDS